MACAGSQPLGCEVPGDPHARRLNPEGIKLGNMDGLSGLEHVFAEEFRQAKIQRCQVQVSRNVIAKVPQKRKQEIADRLRDIFCAPDRRPHVRALPFS